MNGAHRWKGNAENMNVIIIWLCMENAFENYELFVRLATVVSPILHIATESYAGSGSSSHIHIKRTEYIIEILGLTFWRWYKRVRE